MKRLLVLAVLGLALASAPAQAHGGCGPLHINFGFKFWLPCCGGCGGCCNGGGGATLGPWYQYWPYEAHFMTPALPQYPYWPGPQTLPGGAPFAPSPYGH
jgi:hypothetical protein